MISDEELADIVALGHELAGIEFKGPGTRTDKAFFAKVARACLGMSNRRDGGIVVVGVDDKNPAGSAGLNEAQANEWLQYDKVADALHRYADSAIRFELERGSLRNGATVVMIDIKEFEDVPILCRKDYPDVLVAGALYLRNLHKPQTTPFPTHEDMRRLLELAVEKGVRRFLEQAERVGLEPSVRLSDTAQYDDQLGDLA